MEIQIGTSSRIGLVNLPAYFDFSDKNFLIEKVPEWIKTFELSLLVFNFTQTEFIGSSGVYPLFQFLSGYRTQRRRKRVRFAVIGLSAEYKRLLEGMGIKKRFLIYDSGSSFAEQAHRALKLSRTETQELLGWM